MATPDIKTRAWQKTRAAFLANCGDLCAECGRLVDKTLSGRTRWGPSVDHRTPRSRGGALHDWDNLALTHQGCNASKKDRARSRRRRNSQRW